MQLYIPSPARGPRETFSLAAVGVFLGGILSTCWVVGWNMERKEKDEVEALHSAWIQKMTGVCPTHDGSFPDWPGDDLRPCSSEWLPEAGDRGEPLLTAVVTLPRRVAVGPDLVFPALFKISAATPRVLTFLFLIISNRADSRTQWLCVPDYSLAQTSVLRSLAPQKQDWTRTNSQQAWASPRKRPRLA